MKLEKFRDFHHTFLVGLFWGLVADISSGYYALATTLAGQLKKSEADLLLTYCIAESIIPKTLQ